MKWKTIKALESQEAGKEAQGRDMYCVSYPGDGWTLLR